MNLTLVGNSLWGGNIVAVIARQLIRMKARMAAAEFRAKVYQLQLQSGDMQYTPPQVCLGAIPINVKKQEVWMLESDMTMFTMEDGVNLSDHIIQHPVRIEVEFELTNWDMMQTLQAHDSLMEMWQNRELLDLPTQHKYMKNMVMTRYHAENSMPNWGALQCRATFQQAKFVSNTIVTITTDKTLPTENTGGPNNSKSATTQQDLGKQTPQDIHPEA